MAGVCKLCGKPYEDGAKFCVECGAVLISRVGEGENAPKAEEKPLETTAVENNEQTTVENVENTENNGGENTVSNPYGAENAEIPTAYTNPYANQTNNTQPYGNPYANQNNGAQPYGNPYVNNPYGNVGNNGGNYRVGTTPYVGGPNTGNNGGANCEAPFGTHQQAPNPSAPNGYNAYGFPCNPNAVMQPQRNLNIGLLVFSIINILLGCCSCTGLIFGGAGLAFTMMAKNAKTDGDEASYRQIAMIINIIGIVLTVLTCIAVFSLGFLEGFTTVE